MRLHHVQVACPAGGEDVARSFYAGALAMSEVDKPADPRARGGVWFRAHDEGGAVTAEIHVGVEEPFVPARTAHPALLLDSPAHFRAVASRLTLGGHELDLSQSDTFPGHERLHTRDGHGNRIEILVQRV